MAVSRLRLSELSSLAPEEKQQRLAQFLAARRQPLNGEPAFLDERIAAFEKRYEMSSAVMREKLSTGELPETVDVGTWIMLLDAREKLVR
jgi:hypothetical protein